VNGSPGTFGSTTSCVTATVNAKGLVTALSAATCAPALGSVTGLGTGVATALAIAANGSGGFVTSPVANANLATMAALSVKANATNATAAPTDVSTTSGSNFPLRENGSGVLSFGPLNGGFALNNNSTPLNKLANGTANTVIGATSAAAHTDLSVPSCSAASNALQWVSGTGFQCATISGGSATPGGSSGQIQWNNAGAFAGFTASGDATVNTGTGAVTVTKINGTTPGGTCGANTYTSSVSSSAVPTCTQPVSTNLSDAVTDTAWTPADGSGAGLTFTSVTARYAKVGKMVTATFRVTFPSTANASPAAVSGFPVALSSNFTAASPVAVGSCFYNSGILTMRMQAGATQGDFFQTSGSGIPNSGLSGLTLSCTAHYVSN
jgi:hypothetical protein